MSIDTSGKCWIGTEPSDIRGFLEAYAEPEHWKCLECGPGFCNVGVGFSKYPGSPSSIKWIYIGVRCANCGVLGCFAGWKVGQDDVAHLFDQA